MSAAEWIAKRRELLADATEGPWEWLAYGNGMQLVRRCAHNHNHNLLETTDDWPPYTQDAALIADARTSLPRALDALEAVLAPHQLHEVPGGQRWCLHCGGDWPCPTVDAAETALRGDA